MAKGSKTGGRRPGSLNKVTVEAKEFCASIVDDPQYQAKLRARALAGNLPPALEAMIWHYAKGKPKEQVDLSLTERIDADIIARLERGRQRNAMRTADEPVTALRQQPGNARS